MTHSERRRAMVPGRALRLVGALAIGLSAASLSAPRAEAAQAFTIDVVDFAYSPATLTVHVGDTVTWTNGDSVDHTATTHPGAPAAFNGPLPPGGSYSVTFNQPGTYAYYCIPHPTMEGSIIVLAAATPAPTSSGAPIPDAAVDQPVGPPLPSALGTAFLTLALLALAAIRLGAARR